ncbi:hypothetical protein [Pantoea sp. VS1]|uniref:hypothetical protein n=1 Tax=Pantoea sp. VS1 TaxID=2003658 RepID=UPI0015953ABC|nr:hypothetical protein [Pantoea sp. VS1]
MWTAVIGAAAGVAGAPGSQWLSHHFKTSRERRASEDKLTRVRYLIATRLVFLLERFAQQCVHSACERGYSNHKNGQIRVEHYLPDLNYSAIAGDWRSLPT